MSKKIISFCLYGSIPMYAKGAIENIKLAKIHYPDWICRFYYRDLPDDVILEIQSFDNTELIPDTYTGSYSMVSRFLPMGDPDVDIMISRDCDSRLGVRELSAVQEWEYSDRIFHIMRDNPYHNVPILGGMFGCKKNDIINIRELLDRHLTEHINQKNCDQLFLWKYIYPLIETNAMIHQDQIYYSDYNTKSRPFPVGIPEGEQFVGGVYE